MLVVEPLENWTQTSSVTFFLPRHQQTPTLEKVAETAHLLATWDAT